MELLRWFIRYGIHKAIPSMHRPVKMHADHYVCRTCGNDVKVKDA